MNEAKLISDLQAVKQGVPEEHGKTLDAAMDVIYDYGRITKELVQLHRHFQIEAKPVFECGVWLCPACHGSVKGWHSYCEKCGKRLGWNGLIPRGRPTEKTGKGKRK